MRLLKKINMNQFEEKLSGGHPNSLGNTIEVVDEVLSNPALFDELFNCYFSEDEVVRLRVSNAMKRVSKENSGIILPYLGRLIDEIALIDQPSTKWTLAQLFDWYFEDMTEVQQKKVKVIIMKNLEEESDWIVLNHSMQTLFNWSHNDSDLKEWLIPNLKKLKNDSRGSVSKRANKLLGQYSH